MSRLIKKYPVVIQDVYNAAEIRSLLGIGKDSFTHYVEDYPEDPLPMLLLPGKKRGQFCLREHLISWLERNGEPVPRR